MNRRKFVQQSSAGALALALVPWHHLLAASSDARSFAIPEGGRHIRHGMVAVPQKLSEGPSWLSMLHKEVFMANGIQASAQDLVHYALQIEQQSATVAFDQHKVYLTDAKGTLEFTRNQKQQKWVLREGYRLGLTPDRLVIEWADDQVWFPLQAEAKQAFWVKA